MHEILGDYAGFVRDLDERLRRLGIDTTGRELSHLAYRTSTFDEYLRVRDAIEDVSSANVENEWNGRPISKLLLREPLELGNGHTVSLVELIPPPHQRDYPMGLEHAGVVIGETFDAFCDAHAGVITGHQDQGPWNQPRYVTFENDRTAKFYRYSLKDVVEKEGRAFDGFHHV